MIQLSLDESALYSGLGIPNMLRIPTLPKSQARGFEKRAAFACLVCLRSDLGSAQAFKGFPRERDISFGGERRFFLLFLFFRWSLTLPAPSWILCLDYSGDQAKPGVERVKGGRRIMPPKLPSRGSFPLSLPQE